MNPDDEDVILQRITITRRLRAEDSQDTVSFEYAAQINWVADLGMLAAAQFDLNEQMRMHWDETAE